MGVSMNVLASSSMKVLASSSSAMYLDPILYDKRFATFPSETL